MSDAVLLIDVGNSRVKWRCGERSGDCLTQDSLQLLQSWAELPPFQQAWCSNVAGSAPMQNIDAVLQGLGATAHWVVPQRQWQAFRCCYDDPSQLGPDRWLACLAAWHEQQRATLVVSVGTALTVDAVTAEGEFIGGIIAPGMDLMKQALATGTARLNTPTGQRRDFPINTPDAIHSGIIAALTGAVHQQYSKLAMVSSSSPRICLCGGGAAAISAYLSLTAEICPDLVLAGLAILAEG